MWQLAPIFRALLQRKFGVFLLVVQISCSITIFSNMAFISQQIIQHISHPSGFDEQQLFSVSLRPLYGRISYAEAQRDIVDLQALAGVERVASSRWVPLAGIAFSETFSTAADKSGSEQAASTVEVSQQILHTLGLRLLAGRNFTQEDMLVKGSTAQPQLQVSKAQNIIITLALAEALFGKGQGAVGQLLYQDGRGHRVIGVADNWQGFTMPLQDPAEKTVFYPSYNQADSEHRYLVRVKNPEDIAAVSQAVSQRLLRNYQNQLLCWIDTLAESKVRANSQNWMVLNVFLVLMVILGFVIAFAICGQTLFWITQRTKQIGIRRALGASRHAIVVHLLVENLMICSLGLLMGVLLSLGLNKIVMQSTGSLPMPPIFLGNSCALLLALCLVSAAVPSWRATKIPPSLASRSL